MNYLLLFRVITTYLECGFLLIVGSLLFVLLKILSQYFQVSYRKMLKLSYGLLIFSVLVPVVLHFLPSSNYIKPRMQMWSGINRNPAEGYAYLSAVKQKTSVLPKRVKQRLTNHRKVFKTKGYY